MNFNKFESSVTEQDIHLLRQTQAYITGLRIIVRRVRSNNPAWTLPTICCHSIAYFIGAIISELKVVHGEVLGLTCKTDTINRYITFGSMTHSWLTTPDGAIIDPYPPGILTLKSPLLLPTSDERWALYAANLYQNDVSVLKEFNVAEQWRISRSLVRACARHMTGGDFIDAFSETF